MSLLNHRLIVNYFRRKKYGKIEQEKVLTSTEKIILEKISIGKSYHTIANEMKLSKDEVQKTIRKIYQKLQQNQFK